MSHQPEAAYLGDSFDDRACFPFLLIFGREYNNSSGNEVSGWGTYCFGSGCSPRSLFWNRAYRLVEQLSGHIDLKTRCRVRGQSPILFSNVLIKPIPNASSSAEKRRERANARESDIDRHVDFVFSDPTVKKRLHAVVLSGVDQEQFQHAVGRISERCKKLGIQRSTIPYLGSRKSYGAHYESIQSQLTNNERDLVRSVVDAFYREPRTRTEPWVCDDCGGR